MFRRNIFETTHLTTKTWSLQLHIKLFNMVYSYVSKKHIKILEHMRFEEKNVEPTIEKMIIHDIHIVYVAPYESLSSKLLTLAKELCIIPLNQTIFIVGESKSQVHLTQSVIESIVKCNIYSSTLCPSLVFSFVTPTSLIERLKA